LNATLDDDYLEYLEDVVGAPSNGRVGNHKKLLKQLYSKEFVWIVPNDDNRCLDGLLVREEFIREYGSQAALESWRNLGCSTLEMIIGLARRLSFEAEGEPHEWFWILLRNLEIDRYTDSQYNWRIERRVNEILDRLIWRQYEFDGLGGLFPLRNPHDDQRKQEIWYQLGAYVLELE
jgi:hypothetical protein